MKSTNIQIVISEELLDELMSLSNAESIEDAIRLAVEHCIECKG
ncbi:MAG: DUF5371 family protein [Archaeoglobus sp.]|nr:DUF5371 family protein [Archaeoglobus sp.]